MKTIVAVCMVFLLWSCTNDGGVENRMDSVKRYLDTTAEKIGDSVKAKSQRLEQKIEERLRKRKDSSKLDSTNDF